LGYKVFIDKKIHNILKKNLHFQAIIDEGAGVVYGVFEKNV
jgi:hypothetical protein